MAKEFSEFISSNGFAGILSMSEFWAAKFGCNNPEREDELFKFWAEN